ncbi:MAG: hypothetical protein IT317_09020 [Anaerolineales bacterium]|nr:hypothetical protein [Anaerolineales bacterium]
MGDLAGACANHEAALAATRRPIAAAERATFTRTAEARLAQPWPGGSVPA